MRTAVRLLLALMLLPSACGATPATAPVSTPTEQLAAVAAANHKYFYVADAILDGYLPAGQCMQSAQGAMGQHYVNSRYLAAVDAMHPPELLYLPVDGTMRLAGVEYFADATRTNQPPTLFGREFDGPMAGHFPGQPEHYDLHVWLYVDNPAGTFAQWDPALSC